MHLSNIKIWNFRRFGSSGELDLAKPNLDLAFTEGLNVIIGENDSGKTAIIDAIKLVLKTHSYDYIRADNDDFFTGALRFRIELTFEGLSPDEGKNFTEWLGWKGTGADATPFLKLVYDVKRQDQRILPSDIRAGVDAEGSQLSAEAREYLKATYLKPLRDAESELIAKKNSRLSQILLGDAAFKNKGNDHELVKIFKDLSDELAKYFRGEAIEVRNEAGSREEITPQEGKAIKDKVDKYIQAFYSKTHQSLFDSTSSDIKTILEKISLSLAGESSPGLGTLNRLFMAAELLHLSKENWSGVRLGLVEELEAHLHPQAQMQVIEALQKQKSIQLILTTHSPNLASKLKLEHLIICNNGCAFPLGARYTQLEGKNYKFLEKFLDVTKANLFFAKGVILVEGWAEEILLPSIAKNVGINLTEKGVSIVNVGNLGFSNYVNIFLRREKPYMEIPVAVVTDVDIREYDKSVQADGTVGYVKLPSSDVAAAVATRTAALQAKDSQSVKYFIAPHWTLEYCLHKSSSLSSTFQSCVIGVHTGTTWGPDFEKMLAGKLIDKGLNKTEIAYQIAAALDDDLRAVEEKEKVAKTINIDPVNATDTINYLIKAIQYASRS